MQQIATPEDRKHFCTYEQARAAIPNELPFKSNGHTHVAVNLSTGHAIPCADAYIAAGYVAGSAELFKRWRFVLEMGHERVEAIAPHPRFARRLGQENWQQMEEEEAADLRELVERREAAMAAHDRVMAGYGPWSDEDF